MERSVLCFVSQYCLIGTQPCNTGNRKERFFCATEQKGDGGVAYVTFPLSAFIA